ncbi:DGQHR domain-containing protein [Ferrimonas balearica]|uniref:DGQHR domain-containing protein n=1 Tax=Ferrimonas balearica TaxID=44012 RepID=UPI001C99CE68|nr:DGQHR domain-containing protein [Ferrimonas balearica]MBY5993683.1 DGQHR domain-containing protein [Ferrimonas balearica]
MKESIEIQALELKQPIGKFYIGVINAEDLISISYSDIRTMSREVEDYLGIQRELKDSRIKDIKEYISTLDATFPNSIIISIKGKYVAYNNGTMRISFDSFEKERVAKILDGQHRLAGFDSSNMHFLDERGEQNNFQLIVTVFVERDISIQAKVFAMVNQNQTKVNPSLVYDLESLSTSRSPDKTAHQIAVLLNKTEGSPFHQRIKRLGVKSIDSDGKTIENELLTQAAFVSNLVKLISPRPKEDRNVLLGKAKGFLGFRNKSLSYTDSKSLKRCVFRKSFINERDEVIAWNVNNFFCAVENTWPTEWDKSNKGSVLNKTVGFIALVRYLRNCVNIIREAKNLDDEQVIPVSSFEILAQSSNIPGDYFYSVDAVSKSSGQIYKHLDYNTLKDYRDEHGKIDINKVREIL